MKKVLVCVKFGNGCNYDGFKHEMITRLFDIGYNLDDYEDDACRNNIIYHFGDIDIYVLIGYQEKFHIDYTNLQEMYSDVCIYEYNKPDDKQLNDIIDSIVDTAIDNKNKEAATKTLFINLPDKLMNSEYVDEYVEVITKIAELKFGCPLRSIYTKPKDGPYENKNNNDIWKLSKYTEEMSSADYYAGVDLFQKTKIYNWINDTANDFDIPRLEIPYYIFEKYE